MALMIVPSAGATRTLDDVSNTVNGNSMDDSENKPSLHQYVTKAHPLGAVTSLSYGSDGKFASGGSDCNVRLWFNHGPTFRSYTFQGHTEPVTAVAYDSMENIIASSSLDCTLRLWRAAHKGAVRSHKAHCSAIRSVDLCSDASKVLTASDDKSIKVFQVQNLRFCFALTGHRSWVRQAKFSPDDHMIASSSDDCSVRLFDLASNTNICSFADASADQLCVAWHPSSLYVASGSADRCVRLYDLRMRRLVQMFKEHTCDVNSVAFHCSGTYLFSCSNDMTVKVYDLLEGRIDFTLYGHEQPVRALSVCHDGTFLASGADDGQAFIWKTNLGKRMSDNMAPPATRAFSPKQVVEENGNGYYSTLRHTHEKPVKDIPSTSKRTPGSRIPSHFRAPLYSSINQSGETRHKRLSSISNEDVFPEHLHSTPQKRVTKPASSVTGIPPSRSTGSISRSGTSTQITSASAMSNHDVSLSTVLNEILNQLSLVTQSVSGLEKRLSSVETTVSKLQLEARK